MPGQEGRYYLFYFDVNQPAEYDFDLAKARNTKPNSSTPGP